jgi:hypothetical protein
VSTIVSGSRRFVEGSGWMGFIVIVIDGRFLFFFCFDDNDDEETWTNALAFPLDAKMSSISDMSGSDVQSNEFGECLDCAVVFCFRFDPFSLW